MDMHEFEELAIQVLEQNPNAREFNDIRYEMLTENGKMRERLFASANLFFDDDFLYSIFHPLKKKYDIKLYSDELKSNLEIHIPGVAEVEILGSFLNEMPEYYSILKKKKSHVELLSDGSERGYVYGIVIDGEKHVLKPFQDMKNEPIIAISADQLKVGPQIKAIGIRCFAEEFISGNSLLSLILRSEGEYLNIPAEVGRIYGILHGNGILYNDRFMDHMFFDRNYNARLIDYGMSLKTENFSEDFHYIDSWIRESKGIGNIFHESYEKALKGVQ